MTEKDGEPSSEELLDLIDSGTRAYQPKDEHPEPDSAPATGTGVAAPVAPVEGQAQD